MKSSTSSLLRFTLFFTIVTIGSSIPAPVDPTSGSKMGAAAEGPASLEVKDSSEKEKSGENTTSALGSGAAPGSSAHEHAEHGASESHAHDSVVSEQKVSGQSAAKEEPNETVGDKISGAAKDTKDAVVSAANSAGKAAGEAANSISGHTNGVIASGPTGLSMLSLLTFILFATLL